MANELRVRARNMPAYTLSSGISDSDVTIAAPELAVAATSPVIGSTNHLALFSRDTGEVMYVTLNTQSGSATVVRGQEGTTAASLSSGAKLYHGPTIRDHASGKVAWQRVTAGNKTVNSTSWTFNDSSAAQIFPDLTIKAFVGDLLEAGVGGLVQATGVEAYFDLATIVSAAIVNHVSGAGGSNLGNGGWLAVSGTVSPVSGSIFYQVVSGDLSSGSVALRFVAKMSATGSRVLAASSALPFHTWVKNHGPKYIDAVFA